MRRMSEKKRLIKKLRNEFEADKDMTMSDPDRIREISRSSRTAYQSRYRAERNGSMAWLIIRQIRYAGRIVWMCQAAFLVCIAFICNSRALRRCGRRFYNTDFRNFCVLQRL